MRSQLPRVVCCCALLGGVCVAQAANKVDSQAPIDSRPPVTLVSVLAHLQSDLDDYRGNVPNFYCNEHVISDINLPNRSRIFRTTTDSIFSLQRSNGAGKPKTFKESHEVRRVNGVPSHSAGLQGPAIFYGAFSGALSVISTEMERCYDYRLEPGGQLNEKPVIAISYAIKPTARKDRFCPSREQQSGRAWVDPVTLHLLRIEMRTPNHRMNPTTDALWTWAVDYAPVTFDSRQFWMPKTISTKAVANDIPVAWSFVATYGNYHKLTVTSRIITDIGDDPPQ